MSIWQEPSFLELCMNAEIGGYQPDERGDEPAPIPDAAVAGPLRSPTPASPTLPPSSSSGRLHDG